MFYGDITMETPESTNVNEIQSILFTHSESKLTRIYVRKDLHDALAKIRKELELPSMDILLRLMLFVFKTNIVMVLIDTYNKSFTWSRFQPSEIESYMDIIMPLPILKPEKYKEREGRKMVEKTRYLFEPRIMAAILEMIIKRKNRRDYYEMIKKTLREILKHQD